jgi:hypothetical protein
MSFTRIPHTQNGGWGARTPENPAFVASLALLAADAYGREFSELVPAWHGDTWHYIGRFDNAGRFVADAAQNGAGWVQLLPSGTYEDDDPGSSGCCGHGLFFNGGASVNGRYTGTIGDCFGCNGKGYQTHDDRTRNNVYNAKYRRIYS